MVSGIELNLKFWSRVSGREVLHGFFKIDTAVYHRHFFDSNINFQCLLIQLAWFLHGIYVFINLFTIFTTSATAFSYEHSSNLPPYRCDAINCKQPFPGAVKIYYKLKRNCFFIWASFALTFFLYKFYNWYTIQKHCPN